MGGSALRKSASKLTGLMRISTCSKRLAALKKSLMSSYTVSPVKTAKRTSQQIQASPRPAPRPATPRSSPRPAPRPTSHRQTPPPSQPPSFNPSTLPRELVSVLSKMHGKSKQEIISACRRVVSKYHPDKLRVHVTPAATDLSQRLIVGLHTVQDFLQHGSVEDLLRRFPSAVHGGKKKSHKKSPKKKSAKKSSHSWW